MAFTLHERRVLMSEWWASLSSLLKVLYCFAVPSTLILLLQTIFSISGFGHDGDINISDTSGLDGGGFDGGFDAPDSGDIDISGLDTDVNGDVCPQGDADMNVHVHGDFTPLKLFTVQGIVAFFAVSGWVSIAAISGGMPPFLGLPLGVIAGFFAMYGIAKLIQLSRKLVENGTVDFRNAIGENATVYIPIPPNGEGEGKVTLTLQGRFMECEAVSYSREVLKTGTQVRVTDLNGETLVVERD